MCACCLLLSCTAYACKKEHCPPDAFIVLTPSGQFCKVQDCIKRLISAHPALSQFTGHHSASFLTELLWELLLWATTSSCQQPFSPASFTIIFAPGHCPGLSTCDSGSFSRKNLSIDYLNCAPAEKWWKPPMPWTTGASSSFSPAVCINSINWRGWGDLVRRCCLKLGKKIISKLWLLPSGREKSWGGLWDLEMKGFLPALP